MIRLLPIAAALLALTAPAHAHWRARNAVVWTWHPDHAYRGPIAHPLTRREIDAEICRLTSPKPATGSIYSDGRIITLRCARKYGVTVY